MAGLCAPLPTLRRRPCGHLRTAQGRCGSLLLHRKGLAPSTPCRSPGALRNPSQTGSSSLANGAAGLPLKAAVLDDNRATGSGHFEIYAVQQNALPRDQIMPNLALPIGQSSQTTNVIFTDVAHLRLHEFQIEESMELELEGTSLLPLITFFPLSQPPGC